LLAVIRLCYQTAIFFPPDIVANDAEGKIHLRNAEALQLRPDACLFFGLLRELLVPLVLGG
jgi:hypothetical protein